jgi:FtsZ-interacting cell division protein ZipA
MSLFLWLTIAVVVAVTGFLFGRIRRKKNKITPVANDFDLESNDNDHNNENESDDCVLGPSRVISSVNSNNSIKQPNQQKIEPGIEKSAHHKWEDSNIEQNDSEPKFTSSLTGSLTDSHENESLNDIPLYELGHVVQCYVMAPDEETFQGASLLQNLLALGCRFGEMSIFHRFEPASQKK